MRQIGEGRKNLLSAVRTLAIFLAVALYFGPLSPANSLFAADSQETPVFDIPFVEGLTVDGHDDDWCEKGFKVEAMADMQGTTKEVTDLDGHFRIAWDKRGVLFYMLVKDDFIEENDLLEHLYAKDAIEIFLADKRGGDEAVQVLVSPGGDSKHTSVRSYVYDRRSDAKLQKTSYEATCASAIIDGGYAIEVLLPLDGLGVHPEKGTEIGLQVYLDDYDPHEGRSFTSMWYPGGGTHQDSSRMHRIRLFDTASAPASAVGRVFVKGYSHILAKAIGDVSLVGSQLQVEVANQVHGTAVFKSTANRAVASVKLPLPQTGTVWPSVNFRVGGTLIEGVAMPDLETARTAAMRNLNMEFDAYCFLGENLPTGSFPDAVEVANLLGKHESEVTFYDAEYRAVSCAAKPGRYAAHIRITPQKGDVLHRFVPLFRIPDEDTWDLPKQNTPKAVRTLAHRFEIAPGEKVTQRNNPINMEQLWLHGLKKKLDAFTPYRYHVHVPQGASKEDGKLYPAIIFLHGGAGLRRSFEDSKELIPIDYDLPQDKFPFYLFSPHSGPQQWQRTKLDELYEDITTHYPVDTDRIYLTGLSMGGYGSWMYAAAHPDRFAAVVPVCGGGDSSEMEFLKDLPIWNFHGDADTTVSIEKSQVMIDALEKANGRVRFTIYGGVGHNSYEFSYVEPELFPWLLKQVRGKPNQPNGLEVFRITP